MAGAVPRQRCACLDCQRLVLEEMKGIPARFLPHSTRMRLSMILDPVKDLPGRDYRSFADRSGLTPDVWQWLDSQRTQNDTSSIGKVLKYLTDQRGNSYTVYHVYRTLCEMDSDGQRIILEDMREIRRLYNAESRPGQEHTEPSSVVMPPPSLVPGRDKDPPPPYTCHGEQQSDCMTGGAVGMTLNNLGVGCQPEENSFVSGGDHQTTYAVSFSDSQTSYNGRLVSPSPPSCLESQHIYYEAASRMTQPLSQSPTNMQNLKLPLGADCPQVHPGQNFSSRVNDLSNPQRSGHCHGAQQSQMTSLNIQPKPMDKSQPVQPPTLRPISFPYHNLPTYKMSLKSSPRPLSDANFCSHLGACSCKDVSVDVQSPCSVPRSHTTAPSSRALTSYSPSQEQCGQRMTHGSSVSVSSVSCNGQPWNSGHHQTEAKHPLESNHQGQSFYFVFVLAGDMEETERLDQQVDALCQQLRQHRVPYVVIKSTSDLPVVDLPPHIHDTLPTFPTEVTSQSCYVSQCFKKASKVLMLISPGYLRCADGYTEGAVEAVTHPQRLIREYHEELKAEFFNRETKCFRIWPVILGEMKAVRVHVPSFLSNTVFYCFPQQNGSLNLVRLLQKDLNK